MGRAWGQPTLDADQPVCGEFCLGGVALFLVLGWSTQIVDWQIYFHRFIFKYLFLPTENQKNENFLKAYIFHFGPILYYFSQIR